MTTPTEESFEGRTALVTGGSRGIGAATAALLAAHGARVGVNGRDLEAIDGVVASIRENGGMAIGLPADVTDEVALGEAVTELNSQLGPISLLAAFAGGNGAPRPTEQVVANEWRRVVEGDLTSTFLAIRAVLPIMIEERRGAVVTMSSSAGRAPGRAHVAYAAAKAGVGMLTKHLALEYGPQGIRFNCLAPSAVQNEMMAAHMTDEQHEQLAKAFPLGRIGQPADVASAAVFLLSDRASWLTGVTLDISGGRVII